MKTKTLFTGLLAVGMMAAATIPSMAADEIRISFINALTAGEWNTEISSGAEAAIADLDFPVKLKVVGPSNFDPSRQATIFQQEAQTGVDAMIVTNVAPALFIEPGLQAEKSGIMVTWINSGPTAEFADDLFVAADPSEQGLASAKIVADALASKMGKSAADIEGEIVAGHCVPGLAVLENRILGFRAGMKTLMPNVTVLPSIETKTDREGSFVVWAQAIRKTPNALAYVDACEAGMQNIAKIIIDDKLSAVTVAMDSPEDVRLYVRDGQVPGIANSLFFTQAYVATYLTAMALHEGKPAPKGWVKLDPHPILQDEAGAFIEGWKNPVTGLRKFHDADIKKALARAASGNLPASSEFETPEVE